MYMKPELHGEYHFKINPTYSRKKREENIIKEKIEREHSGKIDIMQPQ